MPVYEVEAVVTIHIDSVSLAAAEAAVTDMLNEVASSIESIEVRS